MCASAGTLPREKADEREKAKRKRGRQSKCTRTCQQLFWCRKLFSVSRVFRVSLWDRGAASLLVEVTSADERLWLFLYVSFTAMGISEVSGRPSDVVAVFFTHDRSCMGCRRCTCVVICGEGVRMGQSFPHVSSGSTGVWLTGGSRHLICLYCKLEILDALTCAQFSFVSYGRCWSHEKRGHNT